jgi:hypothetical protein
MTRLLACLVLAFAAGPAAACINDVELPTHEREFRSQYHGPNNPPPANSPEPTGRPSTNLLLGAGVLLLAGAVAFTLVGRRVGN